MLHDGWRALPGVIGAINIDGSLQLLIVYRSVCCSHPLLSPCSVLPSPRPLVPPGGPCSPAILSAARVLHDSLSPGTHCINVYRSSLWVLCMSWYELIWSPEVVALRKGRHA